MDFLTQRQFHAHLQKYGPGIALYYRCGGARLDARAGPALIDPRALTPIKCHDPDHWHCRSLFRLILMFAFLSLLSVWSMSVNASVAEPPPPPPPPPSPDESGGTADLTLAVLDVETAIADNFPPWLQYLSETMLGSHVDVKYVNDEEKSRVLLLTYLDAASVIFFYSFLTWLVFKQNREVRLKFDNQA